MNIEDWLIINYEPGLFSLPKIMIDKSHCFHMLYNRSFYHISLVTVYPWFN